MSETTNCPSYKNGLCSNMVHLMSTGNNKCMCNDDTSKCPLYELFKSE